MGNWFFLVLWIIWGCIFVWGIMIVCDGLFLVLVVDKWYVWGWIILIVGICIIWGWLFGIVIILLVCCMGKVIGILLVFCFMI